MLLKVVVHAENTALSGASMMLISHGGVKNQTANVPRPRPVLFALPRYRKVKAE